MYIPNTGDDTFTLNYLRLRLCFVNLCLKSSYTKSVYDARVAEAFIARIRMYPSTHGSLTCFDNLLQLCIDTTVFYRWTRPPRSAFQAA